MSFVVNRRDVDFLMHELLGLDDLLAAERYRETDEAIGNHGCLNLGALSLRMDVLGCSHGFIRSRVQRGSATSLRPALPNCATTIQRLFHRIRQ